MHLALKAYQELLLTVNEMDRSQDETIRQSSSVIKSKMLTARVQNLYLRHFQENESQTEDKFARVLISAQSFEYLALSLKSFVSPLSR